RLGDPFKPRRDVDTIAKNVFILHDYISQIDADPEFDASFLGHVCVAITHAALNLRGASDGIDYAGKFQQKPVTTDLDSAPLMLGDLAVDEFASHFGWRVESACLVRAHLAAIAHHIGGKVSSEAT